MLFPKNITSNFSIIKFKISWWNFFIKLLQHPLPWNTLKILEKNSRNRKELFILMEKIFSYHQGWAHKTSNCLLSKYADVHVRIYILKYFVYRIVCTVNTISRMYSIRQNEMLFEQMACDARKTQKLEDETRAEIKI